ncbi:MAG: type II toxin-antitoxin system HicB family antitoxin [Halobacteriales archaeon]
MAQSTDADGADAEGREIRLIENPDGWWTARDLDSGAVSQGETQSEALENLREAVDLMEGGGHEPTDEELRELGVDPDIARSQSGELPEVLRDG